MARCRQGVPRRGERAARRRRGRRNSTTGPTPGAGGLSESRFWTEPGLPRELAFDVEVASGRAVRTYARHANDDFGALLDGLASGVAVEVGLGETWFDCVDSHVRKRFGVLHGDHVDGG